jgi:hypothetical protein
MGFWWVISLTHRLTWLLLAFPSSSRHCNSRRASCVVVGGAGCLCRVEAMVVQQ